jgi:hypothetical protein
MYVTDLRVETSTAMPRGGPIAAATWMVASHGDADCELGVVVMAAIRDPASGVTLLAHSWHSVEYDAQDRL